MGLREVLSSSEATVRDLASGTGRRPERRSVIEIDGARWQSVARQVQLTTSLDPLRDGGKLGRDIDRCLLRITER